MSGHSKWAKIKRSKGSADASRGQLFTKLTKEIIFASRQGGPNPDGNFRLRLAIQKARDNNMPLDNIERAIKKGSGELGGATLVELTLEGYGPGGVAVMVEATTDNRNRTVSDVRSTLSKHGGNLGEAGSVAWIFESKGVVVAEVTPKNKDEIELLAIDAGAEDVKEGEDYLEILSQPQQMEAVRKAVEAKAKVTSSEVSLIPKTLVTPNENGYFSMLKLLDHLEELDDVQHVYANVDFPPEIVEKYESGAA